MTHQGRHGLARWMAAILLITGAIMAAPGADARSSGARSAGRGTVTAEQGPNAYIVSFGLYGPQSVFESEAKSAARILGAYFHSPSNAFIRFNSKRVSQADPAAFRQAMAGAARAIGPEKDILVLFLTSHGSRDGLAVVSRKGTGTLSPSTVGKWLDASGARYRIVIVSACYSGIFADKLADRNTLVITAAASDRTSFGCADRVRWTYFGEAFFRQSLRPGRPLADAFADATRIIRAREASEGQPPSNPQFRGGEAVLTLLGQ